MLNRLIYKFSSSSLFTKVPKTIAVQKSTGFLSRLFSNTKDSPSYLLLKQLFQYLQTTDIVVKQFPFIKSDARFQQNWMLIHLILLKKRFRSQQQLHNTISSIQIQKFNYNIQTYFFTGYGQYLNPHIPVRNFAQHFSEVYIKKFQMFETMQMENQRHFQQSSQKTINSPLTHYGEFLKKVVYQDRVKYQDIQLMKLAKYYAAHSRYIESLQWQDLLQYKIKWGFEGDIKLIQNF